MHVRTYSRAYSDNQFTYNCFHKNSDYLSSDASRPITNYEMVGGLLQAVVVVEDGSDLLLLNSLIYGASMVVFTFNSFQSFASCLAVFAGLLCATK